MKKKNVLRHSDHENFPKKLFPINFTISFVTRAPVHMFDFLPHLTFFLVVILSIDWEVTVMQNKMADWTRRFFVTVVHSDALKLRYSLEMFHSERAFF